MSYDVIYFVNREVQLGVPSGCDSAGDSDRDWGDSIPRIQGEQETGETDVD